MQSIDIVFISVNHTIPMLETLYAIPTIYVFIYMNKYFNREEISKKKTQNYLLPNIEQKQYSCYRAMTKIIINK